MIKHAASLFVLLTFILPISPLRLSEAKSSPAEVQIDPQSALRYSTLLGGSQDEQVYSMEYDGLQFVYLTGTTTSTDLPQAAGGFDPTYNGGSDAFVAKVDIINSRIVYMTYLGGESDDIGYALAIDLSGAAYVIGETWSPDFPTTPGAFDVQINSSDGDAFVTKVNPSGAALDYSTFLGGSLQDYGYGITVNSSGRAYVTGATLSSEFPVTPGAFDRTPTGYYDAYVSQLNETGSGLIYSTLLGGGGGDYGVTIVLDRKGNALVAGTTYSYDYPTTANAYDSSFNGAYNDAFLTRLNPTGSQIIFSSFFGGSDSDYVEEIGLTTKGQVWMTGFTASINFPVTPDAYDPTYNGGYYDVFAALFSSSGSTLEYATLLGGSGEDLGRGLAVDRDGSVYIAGSTFSADFPVTANAFNPTFSGYDQAIVVKLNPAGLLYSTFLGGSLSNRAEGGIAVARKAGVVFAGGTNSADFPTTPNAFDRTIVGFEYDAFISNLAIPAIP